MFNADVDELRAYNYMGSDRRCWESILIGVAVNTCFIYFIESNNKK